MVFIYVNNFVSSENMRFCRETCPRLARGSTGSTGALPEGVAAARTREQRAEAAEHAAETGQATFH